MFRRPTLCIQSFNAAGLPLGRISKGFELLVADLSTQLLQLCASLISLIPLLLQARNLGAKALAGCTLKDGAPVQ
jgi:hypothetical protein